MPTQHSAAGSWKRREIIGSGAVCMYLNIDSITALTWQAKPKAVCFYQGLGQCAAPAQAVLMRVFFSAG